MTESPTLVRHRGIFIFSSISIQIKVITQDLRVVKDFSEANLFHETVQKTVAM